MVSTPAARIEDLLEGATTPANRRHAHEPPSGPAPPPQPRADGPSVNITVVWGDLVEVAAGLHVTGHYQSVVPDAAERALDCAISAGPRPLITEHTRLGWIDAQLGEVTYFPCREGPVRAAAVVGMGPMGTLNERRAVQMYASLLGEAVALGHVSSMATVLIGAGVGNLSVPQAGRSLVRGFASALASVSPLAPKPRLAEVLVVEIDRLRAEQLLLALTGAAKNQQQLYVTPDLREEKGGRLYPPSAAVYALKALSALVDPVAPAPDDASAAPAGPEPPAAAQAVLDVLARLEPGIREKVREQLAHLAKVEHTDLTLKIGGPTEVQDDSAPVRMSVLSGSNALRWAALTGRATVPERLAPVDTDLLRDLVDRLTEPTVEDAGALPDLLSRFVVPADFQRLLTDDSTVLLELDRATASVPWEFLTEVQQPGGERRDPLAIRTQLSRQLRTPYSRVLTEAPAEGTLRALVIGDPGDPEKGFQLPGARTEAFAVAAQLKALGVKVSLYVGAPNSTRQPGVEPARRLDVLGALLCGCNDIVHYCGHSDFDRSGTGRRSGWVFADGLLTAQELGRLERPPRIVVANACYTARLGAAEPAAAPDGPSAVADHSPWGNAQAALVPSLADEFLRIGVGHYIGAAWRIPDDHGVAFAEQFYRHLFTIGPAEDPPTVGAAVRSARKRLYEGRAANEWQDGGQDRQRWSSWAAYQHYGDASEPFVPSEIPSDPQGG
ncbi:CHAT domain-containing protein [Streptomyces sp. NPDC004126]|uniref:CHAT domain-containing protein n=1 Tax=Streptomyces sp. NPDC004126 TaxID=3390695 RepID=UPI003CFCFD6F